MNSKNWEKILGEGEKIVFEFSLAKKYLSFLRFQWMSISFFLLVVFLFCVNSTILFVKILSYFFFFIAFLFFIISLCLPWYLRKTNQFALTNRRILAKRGWLSVNLISIPYSKITDISVTQNFWEKLFSIAGKSQSTPQDPLAQSSF
jgi:membrane protein YdbS with pleckstrin-like domain